VTQSLNGAHLLPPGHPGPAAVGPTTIGRANVGPAKIVVLGATGFVGRRVTEALAASPEFAPVGIARRARPDAASAVAWVACDATDPAALRRALAGAAGAVNCVAGSPRSMIEATRNLCAAARAEGLGRIVHLSSMAVYGTAATGVVDETQPLAPNGGAYAQAKAACEALVQAFVASGGDAVILRPGCIHGPESPQWTLRIAGLLQARRIGDLGAAGDGACNLIHVADVAAAVLAALERPGIAGEAFNLGDPDPGTWNSYFMRFGRAIGATPVRRVSPRWLAIEGKVLSAPLKVAQIAANRARLGHLVPEPLPRSLLSLWRQDIRLDHRKADIGLAFPRTPPDRALADAAAWVRGRG
jgi:nucleoside-diphosphate-sugar epimerase